MPARPGEGETIEFASERSHKHKSLLRDDGGDDDVPSATSTVSQTPGALLLAVQPTTALQYLPGLFRWPAMTLPFGAQPAGREKKKDA